METTAVATRSSVSVSLQITNVIELQKFCAILAGTDMVPKAYKGKPDDILVSMLHGQEVGLPHLQALQSIATVNGIPSVYGDAALALVRASGKLDDFDEWIEVDGVRQAGSSFPIMKWADEGKMIIGYCLSQRVGAKRPRTTSYSVDDAKRAGLWGKQGPWSTVPQRMLMFRARGWNLRDEFGDVLKGLAIYEEARDIKTEREPDGSYRPALPTVEQAQPVKTVEVESNGSEKKAAEVLDKMRKPVPTPAPPTATPVAQPDLDAAWLSRVLNAEDFLRGTQQGKGTLRSIRAGFKLADGEYPMLPQEQADYLADLDKSVTRLQQAQKRKE